MALRYSINAFKTDWTEHLPEIEFAVNNVINAFMKISSMKYLTGMRACAMEIATMSSHPIGFHNWLKQYQLIQQNVANTIIFVQAKISLYYNTKHKPIYFKLSQKVYINLQKDVGKSDY